MPKIAAVTTVPLGNAISADEVSRFEEVVALDRF
jgi:hypothetical protein